jgi:hypothetical protein
MAAPPWSSALPAEWRWLSAPVSGGEGGAGAAPAGAAAGVNSGVAQCGAQPCWTDVLFGDEDAAAPGAPQLPLRWDGGAAPVAAALLPERLVVDAAAALPPWLSSFAAGAGRATASHVPSPPPLPLPLPLPLLSYDEAAPALRCLDRTHEPGCTRCARGVWRSRARDHAQQKRAHIYTCSREHDWDPKRVCSGAGARARRRASRAGGTPGADVASQRRAHAHAERTLVFLTRSRLAPPPPFFSRAAARRRRRRARLKARSTCTAAPTATAAARSGCGACW